MKRSDSTDEEAEDGPALQLEHFLPYRLHVCAAAVSDALSRIYRERYGIGMSEWRVVLVLGEAGTVNGVMTAKALGDRSQMHKTKVSRAVAMLERRGYLIRRANVADLREAFLSLTPEGRAVYDDLAPRALAFADRLTASIDEADRDAFRRVLKHLTEHSSPLADDIAKASIPG